MVFGLSPTSHLSDCWRSHLQNIEHNQTFWLKLKLLLIKPILNWNKRKCYNLLGSSQFAQYLHKNIFLIFKYFNTLNKTELKIFSQFHIFTVVNGRKKEHKELNCLRCWCIVIEYLSLTFTIVSVPQSKGSRSPLQHLGQAAGFSAAHLNQQITWQLCVVVKLRAKCFGNNPCRPRLSFRRKGELDCGICVNARINKVLKPFILFW